MAAMGRIQQQIGTMLPLCEIIIPVPEIIRSLEFRAGNGPDLPSRSNVG